MTIFSLDAQRVREILRYYQAGLLNAAFGFGLYSAFITCGLNLYVAQIMAHVCGASFNYLTYSRHAFRHPGPVKQRFALAYIFNYFISLATLAAVSEMITSPYAAGLGSIFLTSIINYFALKFMVFRK